MSSYTERQRRHTNEYWAGFFDGEGSIWIAISQKKDCSRPQTSLKVGIANTHLGIMRDLVADFPPPSGRVLNSFLGGPKDQVRRRQQYKWEMSGQHAIEFLRSVFRFLVIKKDQAALAFEFYEKPWRSKRNGRGGGWKIRTSENLQTDLLLAQRMKGLKHAVCN